MRKPIPPTVLLAAVAALTACSTTTGGQPVAAEGSTSPSASAIATVPPGLNVGSNPTTTQAVPPLTANSAWVLEGGRMGEALIQVNEIDPRLTIGGAGLRSYPVLRGSQLSERVPDATATAFARQKFAVGMTTTRGDDFDKPTVAARIGLYRFESPEEAQKALASVRTSQQRMRSIPITTAAGVIAAEFKPGTVDSYAVEGPFVINISGTGATTEEGAKFVSKGYELELPKVRAFTPTPAASIESLPTDKDGILTRLLYTDPTSLAGTLGNTYYGLPQLLHKIRDISKAAMYREAGVDLVAEGATVLYRTRDDTAAKALAGKLATPSTNETTAASPTNLPQATCINRPNLKNYFCSIAIGRWTATAGNGSLLTAQQAIAAQYTILAKNP